jgi:hypothetical protein
MIFLQFWIESAMGDYLFKILQVVFSLFWRCRIVDRENIPGQGSAVFVSNHLGSFAPVAVLSAFPVRLYPWVEHQTTDWKLCPEYLRRDFVETELRLKPPFSVMVAWVVSKPCVALMKVIRAIPVYGKTMRLATTWKHSLRHLGRNEWLVIFPENDQKPFNDVMNELDDGFIGLGPLYYKKTGKILRFIPVAIHKTVRAIKIGTAVSYDPGNIFSIERDRIKSALQNRIVEMYQTLQSS